MSASLPPSADPSLQRALAARQSNTPTLVGEGVTVGTAPIDLFVLQLEGDQAAMLDLTIAARDVNDGTCNGYKLAAVAHRFGGGSAILGSSSPAHLFVDEESLPWDVDVVPDGARVIVRATGEAGRTIKWVVHIVNPIV